MKKHRPLIMALILCSALLYGCSAPAPVAPQAAPQAEESYDMAAEAPAAPAPAAPAPMPSAAIARDEGGYAAEPEASTGAGEVSTQNATTDAASELKIIRNADISLATLEFDQTLSYIESQISALGGYIESSTLSGKKPVEWREEGRVAFVRARIPADKSENFLKDIQLHAEVESTNTYSNDITAQFVDAKSRVEVLNIQLQRLKDILVTRDKLSDVLELEREIARITTEIEQLTTNLRQWDNLVEFATVSINLREVTELTAPKPVDTKLDTRITEGFNNSVTAVGRFLGDLVVFLVSALPVLVLLAIVAAIIWLIVRRAAKRVRKHSGKNAELHTAYYQAYAERFNAPPDAQHDAPPQDSDKS